MLVAALSVPLLTVAGPAASLHSEDIENDWAHRQQDACRHMPFPNAEYVAAWAGLALGLAAVVVGVVLIKRIRRQYRDRLGDSWPAILTYISVFLFLCLNVLAVPMELIMVYVTHSNAGSLVNLGDC
ncbi:hypothetical protein [Streptomyces cinnamoneus]|nr:hypothetical protein [Streptomyces cinnamoneus]